jgi:pyruvate formate lyase activating enzyme
MSEKGTVFDIQRASLHDGPGIRTTVFLKGCPLNCPWCHNPEALSFLPGLFFFPEKCTACGACAGACDENVHHIDGEIHNISFSLCNQCGKCVEVCSQGALRITGSVMSVEEVMAEILADVDFYNNSGGGMTLSGGEPLSQFSFSLELLKCCRKANITTCIETSGYLPAEQFGQILEYTDILLFDYKISGSEEHKKYTGLSNEMILINLDIAYNSGIPVILRCPVIPGINDTDLHFKAISSLNRKYPGLKGIEILPYHNLGNNKRISIGQEPTLNGLGTTGKVLATEWIDRLITLGCKKAIISR